MQTTNEQRTPRLPIDNKVTFLVQGKNTEINLGEVKEVFLKIDKYNNQFSLGSMMGKAVLTHLEEAKNYTEKNEDWAGTLTSFSNDVKNDQQAESFFLIAANKATMDRIGLSLKPVSGKIGRIITEVDDIGEGQIRINVSNHEYFTSFLAALKPEQITEDGIQKDLKNIAESLAKQVLDEYDLLAPGDEAMQLFGGMEKIIEEYKRMGMGKSVEELENYLNHGKIGDLREYVTITRKGYLSPPGKSFGPADWQSDSTPEKLEERWNEALDILLSTLKNPKAIELSKQMYQHLISCVDVALKDTRDLNPLNWERAEKRILVLQVAQQKLQQMPYGTDLLKDVSK